MPDNLYTYIHSCPVVCEVGAHPAAEATIKAVELLALELQMQSPPLLNDLGTHIYVSSLSAMMVRVRRIHSEIC